MEEFLRPMHMSVDDLANDIDEPASLVRAFIRGFAKVTPTLADKLGVAFGTTTQFWLNLQQQYDRSGG